MREIHCFPSSGEYRSFVHMLLIAVVLAIGLGVAYPAQLSAQWKLQGGYSFLSETPGQAVGASLARTVRSLDRYSLTLRLGAEGGTDLYEGGYFTADTRVFRGYGALTADVHLSRLHLSGGVLGGIEQFDRTVGRVPGSGIPDMARPPDLDEVVPYVGGLLEVGYEIYGPIHPFLAYRQEFVFHERSSDQGIPELWNLRRYLRGVALGIGVSF